MPPPGGRHFWPLDLLSSPGYSPYMPRHNTPPTDKLRLVRRKNAIGQGKQKVTSPRALRLLERRWKIWEMRKDGHSVRDIAQSLKIAEDTVREDIVTIGQRMATGLAESVEENRSLTISRLDALLFKYQALAENGDKGAAALVLSIEARRAKLLALDTPEKKSLEVSGIREYVNIDLDQV